jgi:hypothetical protein
MQKHSFNDNTSDLSLTNMFKPIEIVKDISSAASSKSNKRSNQRMEAKEPDIGSAYEPDDESGPPIMLSGDQVTPSLVKQ